MSVVKCPRPNCGALLEPITDSLGRVAFVCRPCERNRAGRCRDCLTGRVVRVRVNGPFPFRCDPCRAKHAKRGRVDAHRRWYRANRRRVLAAMRKTYHTDTEARAVILARMAAYRRANPRTDADRMLHRIYSQRHRAKKAA